MNDATRDLVRAICHNLKQDDILFYTKRLLQSDKTAKDESFKNKMLTIIEQKEDTIVVPSNCGLFLIAEKDANINLNRYYLSERESKVFKKIETQQKVTNILEEKNVPVRNSILLYGESGTGKTTFGRYIAKQLHLPFLYINFSYLIDSLLGKTQQNLANAFRFAKSMNCVFMLDEMDAIAQIRGKSDVTEMSRITISLMQELDAIKGKTIFIGATNRLDILDSAIVSRMGIKHEIVKFTAEERELFVKKYLEDVAEDIQISAEEFMDLCSQDVSQRKLETKIISFLSQKYYEKIESEGL